MDNKDTNRDVFNRVAEYIVTCSQSFHWMEPHSTLAEIARILRPGGVFSAYDYQWPPTVHWQAETAFNTFIDRAWALKEQRGLAQDYHIWTQNRDIIMEHIRAAVPPFTLFHPGTGRLVLIIKRVRDAPGREQRPV